MAGLVAAAVVCRYIRSVDSAADVSPAPPARRRARLRDFLRSGPPFDPALAAVQAAWRRRSLCSVLRRHGTPPAPRRGLGRWREFVRQHADQIRLLRRATTGHEATASIAMFRVNRVIGSLSALGILVPGLYMTACRGWAPWIVVGLATWALILVLGAANGIRMVAVGRRLPTDGGPISADLQARLRDPIAVVSWWTGAGMAFGIVFLMTVRAQ
jgi:hypothetical protein